MMEIEHKIQPTHNTCVQTCLAMIFNLPVKKVIEETRDGELFIDEEFKFILQQRAYPSIIAQSTVSATHFPYEGIYLVTVPSKTFINSQHRIVIVIGKKDIEIYDPCNKPDFRYTKGDFKRGMTMFQVTHVTFNFF